MSQPRLLEMLRLSRSGFGKIKAVCLLFRCLGRFLTMEDFLMCHHRLPIIVTAHPVTSHHYRLASSSATPLGRQKKTRTPFYGKVFRSLTVGLLKVNYGSINLTPLPFPSISSISSIIIISSLSLLWRLHGRVTNMSPSIPTEWKTRVQHRSLLAPSDQAPSSATQTISVGLRAIAFRKATRHKTKRPDSRTI